MEIKNCKCGNELYLRDLCRSCYRQLPHIKAKRKEENKKYHNKPDVKARVKKLCYTITSEQKKRRKLRQQTIAAKETAKKWKQEPEVRKRNNELRRVVDKYRRKNDLNFKIKQNLNISIRRSIKRCNGGKKFRTHKLLGCSILEFIRIMEIQMPPGMSWENHGLYTWHIGHIKPQSKFDLTDPEQQKQCWHWTNLQPEWAIINITKQDKW